MQELLVFLITTSTIVPRTAPGPLVTDRPDATESAVTVAPGFFQFETGALTASDGGTDSYEVGNSLLRIGLGKNVELRLGWSGLSGFDAAKLSDSGIGDTSVGAKVVIDDGTRSNMAVAILAGVTLPTGESGFTTDEYAPTFRLAVSRDLGKSTGVGANAGIRWEGNDSFLLYTLSFGHSLSPRLGAFAEVFGELQTGGGPQSHSIDSGLTFLVKDIVQLDLSGGLGLNRTATDAFLGAGLSVRLPN